MLVMVNCCVNCDLYPPLDTGPPYVTVTGMLITMPTVPVPSSPSHTTRF